LCLDFIRTLRYRGRPEVEEELPNPERLEAWVRQFGPCRLEEADLRPGLDADARVLREAVQQLVSVAVRSEGVGACPTSARETVNAWASLPVPAPHIDGDGRVEVRAQSPVRATLALIARDALELVSSPDLGRIRSCANPSCRVLFLDSSRPGSRRWCSMTTCGNRAKKATQRARHSPAGDPTSSGGRQAAERR
jgi:predicted RNA-binding Zn ribbon-like protein